VSAPRPAVGLVGIHSGGRPGQAVSQSEVLAGHFRADGVRVRSASSLRHPVLRTLHQAAAVVAWRGVPVVVVDVFSGRSFRMAEIASWLARRRGRRVILFLHGGGLGRFAPAHRRRVARVLERADAVLAPSEFLARTFRPWGHEVRVIPNVVGVDPDRGPERDAPRPALLWMRTFQEDYDPLTAVRCLARVLEDLPEAHLTMAGPDHGLLEATRREAGRLGIGDRVTFPGYLDEAAKRREMAAHDVFLNTNLVDNSPVSVIEAAASGMVPVATAVGGIPDLLSDGADGVLVPAGDADAMAAAIVGLVGDPVRFRALSDGARALARRSTWREVRPRWSEELAFVAPAAFGAGASR
jgi:glycosyltransferase involved in cell wall biosynthesis